MKRIVLYGFCAPAIAAMTLFGGPTAASAKDLIYGSFIGPRTSINRIGLPPYFEAVARDTKGSVNWQLKAGGQLVTGRSTLAGIRDRIVDAGLIISSFTRKELKTTNTVTDMQFYSVDPIAVMGASTETILLNCPECLAEHRRSNAIFLAGFGLSAYKLYCSSVVKNLADLKGKKVRATGGSARWVKAMGGLPLPMPVPDSVQAMQRGVLDCVLGPVSWLKGFGFMDMTKSVIDYPMGISRGHFLIAMNRDSWTDLSRSEKAVMIKHIPSLMARTTIVGYIGWDAEVLDAAKKKGITVTKGGKEFDTLLAKHVRSEETVIPAVLKKLGVKNPESIMDRFKTSLKKWQGLSPQIGLDVDKFSAALKREIYDKIDIDKL